MLLCPVYYYLYKFDIYWKYSRIIANNACLYDVILVNKTQFCPFSGCCQTLYSISIERYYILN